MKVLRILRYLFLAYFILIIIFSIIGAIFPFIGLYSRELDGKIFFTLNTLSSSPILGLTFPYEIMNFVSNVKEIGFFSDPSLLLQIFLYLINQVSVFFFFIYMIWFLKINDIKEVFKSKNVENFKKSMIAIFVEMGTSITLYFYFMYQNRNVSNSIAFFFSPTAILGFITSVLAGLFLISIYSILKKGKEVKEDSDLTI